jgi:hypothetical protein
MEPAYPASRAVASRIHQYFARHHAAGLDQGQSDIASVPDRAAIEAMVNAAFWASLRREEGYVPKISLAFLSTDEATRPLVFERPMPLSPALLARVAPAIERPGIHLAVWNHGASLHAWGVARNLPQLCFVLEVAAPGLLVVKHRRGEDLGKFVNVAVLEGDQIKVIDEHASSLPDCPSLLSSLLGFDSPASWRDSVNVLVQVASSMRSHGRGGALLVVPAGPDVWRQSVVHPISYAVSPPFDELASLMREPPDRNDKRHGRKWRDALDRAVETIAGLTAVDGATVITDQYELLGFGAKIGRRKGSPRVEQIAVTEPIEGSVASLVHPLQLGGTRHLSAAQFVHDQRDALALVASQDGHFTVFAWSPCEDVVHAHRVETLLL